MGRKSRLVIGRNRGPRNQFWLVAVLFALPWNPAQLEETWRGLTIAEESRCAAYDSGDYAYPQSVEDRIIARQGGVYSPYTGEWFADKYETDIEHIVARSEAHDSGLCAADAATRRRFARDIRNLTLASPRLNRYEKRAKDAAEWLPEKNRCWFAHRVIEVRKAYSLTIDEREARALDAVLATCESSEMVRYPRAALGTAMSFESEDEAPCGPYSNCEERRNVCGHTANQSHH